MGDLEVKYPRQNVKLQIAAKPSVLCCHLTNTNEKRFRLSQITLIGVIF